MEVNDEISAFAVYSNVNTKKSSRNHKRRLKKHLAENLPLGEKTTMNTKKLIKKGVQVFSAGMLSKEKSLLQTRVSEPHLSTKKKMNKKMTAEIVIGDSETNNNSEIMTVTVNGDSKVRILKGNDDKFDVKGCYGGRSNVSLGSNKSRKLKRKKLENVSPVNAENLSFREDVGHEKDYKKAKKKKVCIEGPEPCSELKNKTKKPIVCTPRFVKQRKSINDFENKRQLLGVSPNKILLEVDQYLSGKKEVDHSLSNSGKSKGNQTVKNIELAQMAKAQVQMKSSEVAGKYTFEKIMEPICVDSFMRENWEKTPLHIPASHPKKFSKLISTDRIDAILRERVVNFGKHLDVTSYSNGKRETHNLEGRANAHVVWDFYANGCSVRLLNPQYFFHSVHSLNAMLQEYFGCFVGANSYLTPPMSQGFAPHYDDIEAFILQIEGSKIWKLYRPMNKNGYLPRYSSRNLHEEEIGVPVLEVKLNPGDVLYFPRGYIHQGRTEKEHSLHLTLSVYQRTAWCDFLEKLLPLTLKKAASQDVEFRKGLPIGYLKSAGLLYKNAPTRKEIVSRVKTLITRLNEYLDTDAAMDQMGLSFIQDALPPVFTVSEAACTVLGDGWKMRGNGKLQGQTIITQDTKVRWTRAFCYRILKQEVILEDGTIEEQIHIYHSLENSKEYHAEAPQFLVADVNMLSTLRYLTAVYPKFIKISELPSDDEEGKILFVSDLWDRGLLMTDTPLELYNSESVVKSKQILTSEELEILSDLEEKIPKDENQLLSSSGSESESEESSDNSTESRDEEFMASEDDISDN